MKKILVIEDDATSAKIISSTLMSVANIQVVDHLQMGRNAISTIRPDLLLLDLSLPDGSGFDLLHDLHVKNTLSMPVVILSSDERESTKVQAFDLGVHDYIQKPYALLETKARIERVLRARNGDSPSSLVISYGPLKLNTLTQTIEVQTSAGTESHDLTAKEFKILKTLMERPNTVLDRQKILNLVWGPTVHLTDRTIDTHLAAVRKKLGKAGEMIRAVRGVGYEFEVSVTTTAMTA